MILVESSQQHLLLQYYHPHLTNEKAEAQGIFTTYPTAYRDAENPNLGLTLKLPIFPFNDPAQPL